MTILTILLFISCILFLIGYRKERSRRIALEKEVKSACDRLNSFSDWNKDHINKLKNLLEVTEKAKPKAMTAPIVKFKPQGNESQKDLDIEKLLRSDICTNPKHKEHLPKIPRGYKRHDGKRVPKGITKKTMVSVIFRNGIVKQPSCGWNDAELWDHVIDDSDMPELDIIAYKVVKPKTMKRKKK